MRMVLIISVVAMVAAAAVGTMVYQLGNWSAAGTGYWGCTDSVELANISIRPSHQHYQVWKLQIPQTYLGFSRNWTEKEQSMVYINATYPSLEPRPTGTFWQTCSQDANRGVDRGNLGARAPDHLEVRITADGFVGSPLVGFREPASEYLEVESKFTDLKHLVSKCMLNRPWPPDPKVPTGDCPYEFWYVPEAQNKEQPIVIRCLGVEENPSASCSATFVFRGHKVEYTFKRTRLGEWRDFNAATLKLLHRFTRE